MAEPVDGITFVACDITDAQQVSGAVERAAGSLPLRVVVNCAGMAPSARILGRTGIHDLELFTRTVHVNLVGTFTVLAIAANAISQTEPDIDGQRGAIINTASIAAFEGQMGQAAYAASKGGVAALTLPAARDLASVGIRVVTIAPGIVDTPMMASFSDEVKLNDEVRVNLAAGVPFPRRMARPDEFAELVRTVIEHDYLNGEVIRMDGALRMGAR